MMKRILAIIISLCILITTFTACSVNEEDDETSNTTESTTVEVAIDSEGTIIDTDGSLLTKEDYTVDNSGNIVTNDGKVIGNVEEIQKVEEHTTKQNETTTNSSTNSNNVTTKPNETTTKKPSIPSTTGSTTVPKPMPLVIPNGDLKLETKPTLSEAYLIPSKSERRIENTGATIYENKYVKLDLSKIKSGYYTITYKDKWADDLQITIDEMAVPTEEYVKSYHYSYSGTEFKDNVLTLSVPKKEAYYYISIWSTINGTKSCKFELDMGKITTDGAIAFDMMLPDADAIKLTQTQSGIYTNKYVKINTNTASKGYIELQYIEPNGYDIKVNVFSKKTNQKGAYGAWHYWTNYSAPCTIKVPLTYGNTEYTINVWSTMSNGEIGRASKKAELTIKLNNVSSTGGFLLSTGEVIYNSNMDFIKKANEIAATCSNDFEIVSKIYDWLTSYISYKGFEPTALREYKCNLQTVYNRKAGVCYDYAVVLAAMLRSQGIPCKVVFGKYSAHLDKEGHVWNEVYIDKTGSISTNKLAITGNKWCRLDPTLTSVNDSAESITYMNKDSNYLWYDYY